MWNQYKPEEIEAQSFRMIQSEIGTINGDLLTQAVIYRVIHATADFSFSELLCFSDQAASKGRVALQHGTVVYTDTNMALAGISKLKLAEYHSDIYCLVADPSVVREAKEREITRSVVAIEQAVSENPESIFVIGNAPTALLRLCELIQSGDAKPALVIGVPVGFVNVEESKQCLMKTDVPYIVAQGRKGGSTVATAIVNALLYGEQAAGIQAIFKT